ncbi:Tetratricopeptide repeat [Trypanosoma melophagium]|uniref:Tetratricopeptide repeat n=1 Tax=Trypanosoma melophagium TaxID=715481 RepID=UPI00351A4279|nr:Tetratricopeptide repeat [Trypanosoma melophagium]
MSSSSSSFTSYPRSPLRSNHFPDEPNDGGIAQPPRNESPTPDIPSAKWLQKIITTCFHCELCHKVVIDPVQIVPNVMLTCRRCALSRRVSSEHIIELPTGLIQAFEEIYEAQKSLQQRNVNKSPEVDRPNRTVDDSIAGRRMVRVKRTGINAAKQTPLHTTPADAVKAASKDNSARYHGIQQELRELVENESNKRSMIEADESSERIELVREHSSVLRKIQSRSRDSSKVLKAEADMKYEESEYTVALELYSKAIEQQPLDRLTRLSALYGNRSSAYFMAQRYSDCISDCMKVVALEPGNVKMYSRAAKASAIIGDLAGSVAHMDSIPENLVTETILNEKKRYKSGYDLLQRAERAFGTPEGDEIWLMLVAQFSDTIYFRMRLAESLVKQKSYMKAVEILDVVSLSRRTPRLLYMMANCLYLSGFEHFEKARLCLMDAQQLDENCAKLLKLINLVDEGKQKGNQLFQQKKFASAVEHYTSAINAAENNNQILRILYCNRAAAHKELGRYREGIEDCTKAIQLDPEFSKAYARRARCQQQLNNFAGAIRDFKSAIQYDPNDRELERELRNCEHNMAKEAEREKDYYYVLGVSRNCNEREIKLRYRELSLRWHPDKCMSLPEEEREQAERRFKVIGEAHTTLIDPARRREYDFKLDRERLTRGGGFAAYGGDTFRGQASRYRAGGGGFW